VAATSPAERRQELQRRIEEDARRVRGEARLNVLIWGPTDKSSPVFTKRCEIRDALIEMGHIADFSEDIRTDELRACGLNILVEEQLEARNYDFIVCLMAGHGSEAEVHDFWWKYSGKMMICVDEQHKEGFSVRGAVRLFQGNNGLVDYYHYPEDITECHLKTRVLEHLEMVKELKQLLVAEGLET
jgi:hypothetical protein